MIINEENKKNVESDKNVEEKNIDDDKNVVVDKNVVEENFDDDRHCKYFADVISVYDADTITVDIQLGFGLVLKGQKIRLYGINAYELRDHKGKEARDFVRELILGKTIILYTETTKKGKDKKGKYGRWLGTIIHNKININKLVVERGYGIYHKY